MKAAVAAVVAVVAVVVVLAHSGSSSSSRPQPAATAEAQLPESPASPASADSPRAPAPPKLRRFGGPAARKRFAESLARARARAAESASRTRGTYGARAPRPTAPGELDQPGKLDKDYIKDRIGEIVPLVAECYELALDRDSSLAGRMLVDFAIDAEEDVGGYVREASVVDESELREPELSECVTETILSLEFEPPEGGGTVSVRYPLVFEHDSE